MRLILTGVFIQALLLANGAMANPYLQGSGSVSAAAQTATAVAQNCQSRLANNSYTCTVVSSFGESFTDTFTFTSPGAISADFDLSTVQLGASLGCGCAPTGNVKKPHFEASFVFQCVGSVPESSAEIVLLGTATSTKITKGQGTNSIGDTFIFTCVKN